MKRFLIGLLAFSSISAYAAPLCGVVEQVIKHHVTKVSGEEIDILAVSLQNDEVPLGRDIFAISYTDRKEDKLIKSQLTGLKVCILNDQVYFDKL